MGPKPVLLMMPPGKKVVEIAVDAQPRINKIDHAGIIERSAKRRHSSGYRQGRAGQYIERSRKCGTV